MKPLHSIIANVNVGVANNPGSAVGFWAIYNSERSRRNLAHILRLIITGLSVLVLYRTSLCQTTGSTCIVVRRTPTEIVVGADSKKIDATIKTDASGEHVATAIGSKCKIGQVDNTDTFFAISAIVDFDADAFAVESGRKSRTLAGKAAAFRDAISAPLTTMLERLRTTSPNYYKATFKPNAPALQVVFFRFERGVPAYFVLDFIPNNASPIHLDIQPMSCPGTYKAQPITSYLGVSDAIRAYSPQATFWHKEGSVNGIIKLIGMEIADAGDKVGGDIDIIRVTSNRAWWVQHGQDCPDVKPYWRQPTPSRRRGQ